jgi:hypothetical protein
MNVESANGSDTESDFYSAYFQMRTSFIFFATYSSIIAPIAIALLYFIIWFELNGPDTQRTLINRLVTPICWVCIFYFFVPQSIDFFRYFHGPYSHNLCYFNLFTKNVLGVMNMFFFAIITVLRYISIFMVNNGFIYLDDFWYRFICLWVTLVSIFIQSVLDYLPGKHPLNYFVCTGKNPTFDTNPEAYIIRNYSMVAGCIMVTIVYIFVYFKILLFQRKEVQPPTNIRGPDMKPMTDYLIVVSFILFSILHLLLLFKIQSLDMTKMDVFPNYIYLYYLHLWFLPNLSIMLTLLYFARNRQMRETLRRELQSIIYNITSSRGTYDVNV